MRLYGEGVGRRMIQDELIRCLTLDQLEISSQSYPIGCQSIRLLLDAMMRSGWAESGPDGN